MKLSRGSIVCAIVQLSLAALGPPGAACAQTRPEKAEAYTVKETRLGAVDREAKSPVFSLDGRHVAYGGIATRAVRRSLRSAGCATGGGV